MNGILWRVIGMVCVLLGVTRAPAAVTNMILTEVPDYGWAFGCMGTASGNLMGYWDRHGFPDMYRSATNDLQAPLYGHEYAPIVSMWATQAGFAGRPVNKPGHVDDYWVFYESSEPDPYKRLGRAEHEPDCLGDFLGLNQNKWSDLAGECSGNIDGFSFVYWATNGERRVNYTPVTRNGEPAVDVQSGLRAWTQWRGYDCEVFTQLVDFNPKTPKGTGFTFADLKAEIDQGYPVILFLQNPNTLNRDMSNADNVNPSIHAMVAYGYVSNNGRNYVRYRTSWASGDNTIHEWTYSTWEAQLPVRGVIGFRPLPKITRWDMDGDGLRLTWHGPNSELKDVPGATSKRVHGYVVEMSNSLAGGVFEPVSPTLTTNTFTINNCPSPAYFRVRLVQL